MSIYCVACRNEAECNEAVQLIPCLHIVCTKCFHGQMKCKVCPAAHCYSQLKPFTDIRWNSCEYEKCLRKLSPVGDVYKAVCQHDLCMQCVDEINKLDLAVCPVGGCGVLLNEDDDQEQCEGPCRSMFDADKLITLACCQVRMCGSCVKNCSDDNKTCPPGKCPQETERKTKKGKQSEPIMCISCLARTLEECEHDNTTPICPNEACRLPYRCETNITVARYNVFLKRIDVKVRCFFGIRIRHYDKPFYYAAARSTWDNKGYPNSCGYYGHRKLKDKHPNFNIKEIMHL
uniref:RING-type domain-containing protein n=1 Tax=Heterorhabditis bacteriophora TaxID=37862 RepID=A0A1I7X514_HETBA